MMPLSHPGEKLEKLQLQIEPSCITRHAQKKPKIRASPSRVSNKIYASQNPIKSHALLNPIKIHIRVGSIMCALMSYCLGFGSSVI